MEASEKEKSEPKKRREEKKNELGSKRTSWKQRLKQRLKQRQRQKQQHHTKGIRWCSAFQTATFYFCVHLATTICRWKTIEKANKFDCLLKRSETIRKRENSKHVNGNTFCIHTYMYTIYIHVDFLFSSLSLSFYLVLGSLCCAAVRFVGKRLRRFYRMSG